MVGINFLGALSFKIKIAVILAVLAFTVSLIAGFFSGAVISVIIIRIVTAIIVFAVMGYCIGFIINKYVPEIMSLFKKESEENPEFSSEPEDFEGQEQDSEQDFAVEDSPFSEMRPDEMNRLSESTSLDPSEGKLGRHIVSTEDTMKYEPKLMAEAIRTMMSKDE